MQGNRTVHFYSPEKLDEFAEMTVEARLQWLEEINRFINTVLGFEKRAETDDRFRDFPPCCDDRYNDKKYSRMRSDVAVNGSE